MLDMKANFQKLCHKLYRLQILYKRLYVMVTVALIVSLAVNFVLVVRILVECVSEMIHNVIWELKENREDSADEPAPEPEKSETEPEKIDITSTPEASGRLKNFAKWGHKDGYSAQARFPSHGRHNIYDGQYL